MKKITLYGSPHCPNCGPVKQYLTENNVQFEYIDITGSMKDLKEFLKHRDTNPVFDHIKAQGAVGIPCTMVTGDGDPKFIFGEPDLEDLK